MITAWLVMYTLAALTAAVLARPVKNLTRLCVCFAATPMLFLMVPVDADYLLVAALVDMAMALLCVLWWCHASRRIAQLALVAFVVNITMYIWYHNPAPHDAFLTAYSFRPDVIRFIELAQLFLLFYFTPAVQRLLARRLSTTEKDEPPCQFHLIR